jgi:Ca2+ transporting ATPase
MEEKSKAKLDEIGGVQAVARGVGSSLKRGLTGNDDVRRKAKYGTNKVERPAPATYVELFVEAMQDTTVLILLTAALISITLSIIVCYLDLGAGCPRKPLWSGPVDLKGTTEDDDSCMGWLDGAAILGACLLIGNITAWNEMSKEKQFRGLQAQQDDCAVVVRRNGMEVRVSAENIMVGDLVSLDTGAKVPADGILIKGNACRMDESAMTGESDTIPKSEEHPFIVSGSTVTDGDCTYLVVAVGEYSEWGRILSELVSERDDTPLQDKLTVRVHMTHTAAFPTNAQVA